MTLVKRPCWYCVCITTCSPRCVLVAHSGKRKPTTLFVKFKHFIQTGIYAPYAPVSALDPSDAVLEALGQKAMCRGGMAPPVRGSRRGWDARWRAGVSREASTEEVKRAFRQRARTEHPDVNKAPDAAARFMKVCLDRPSSRERFAVVTITSGIPESTKGGPLRIARNENLAHKFGSCEIV